ncbi:MAG: hypothetical protein LAT61_09840 [Alcanivorax sp.]|nr:hypothetical protein [Alcanivorax sp.]
MVRSTLLFLSCVLLAISASSAGARTDFGGDKASFLIQACKTATQIFNAHNEKRFLASQRTSLADALRAGYCLGALEQFQCSRGIRRSRSAFDTARQIASMDENLPEHQQRPISRLLQQEVCH